MIDPSIEQLGGRVLAEAEDIAAPDPRHAPGARDEEEPERAHAAEEVGTGTGSLARARLRCGQRVELEALDHVVGEDAELLPGAVGISRFRVLATAAALTAERPIPATSPSI